MEDTAHYVPNVRSQRNYRPREGSPGRPKPRSMSMVEYADPTSIPLEKLNQD